MSLNVSLSVSKRRFVYRICFGLPVEPEVSANCARRALVAAV